MTFGVSFTNIAPKREMTEALASVPSARSACPAEPYENIEPDEVVPLPTVNRASPAVLPGTRAKLQPAKPDAWIGAAANACGPGPNNEYVPADGNVLKSWV